MSDDNTRPQNTEFEGRGRALKSEDDGIMDRDSKNMTVNGPFQ